VSYAYSHRPSKLERALLAASIVPNGHGGLMIRAMVGAGVDPGRHGGLMLVKTITD
jgi:hypothetical protein